MVTQPKKNLWLQLQTQKQWKITKVLESSMSIVVQISFYPTGDQPYVWIHYSVFSSACNCLVQLFWKRKQNNAKMLCKVFPFALRSLTTSWDFFRIPKMNVFIWKGAPRNNDLWNWIFFWSRCPNEMIFGLRHLWGMKNISWNFGQPMLTKYWYWGPCR